MPTVVENLNAAIANYAAALAADSVNPQPDYTLDGKSVSRTQWRESLQKMIDALQKSVNARSPYIIPTRMGYMTTQEAKLDKLLDLIIDMGLCLEKMGEVMKVMLKRIRELEETCR